MIAHGSIAYAKIRDLVEAHGAEAVRYAVMSIVLRNEVSDPMDPRHIREEIIAGCVGTPPV